MDPNDIEIVSTMSYVNPGVPVSDSTVQTGSNYGVRIAAEAGVPF